MTTQAMQTAYKIARTNLLIELPYEREVIINTYHINPTETKWGNIGVEYYKETFGDHK
jgi:hypothetical protein